MDKIKKAVAQLEDTLDVVNKCIDEVKYEASLNNMEPEHLVLPDGTSRMAALAKIKTDVLVKLLEAYVWINEEEQLAREEEERQKKKKLADELFDHFMKTYGFGTYPKLTDAGDKYPWKLHHNPAFDETTIIKTSPNQEREAMGFSESDATWTAPIETEEPVKYPKRYIITQGWHHLISDADIQLPRQLFVTAEHHSSEAWGKAYDFRREISGHISAEIRWYKGAPDLDIFKFSSLYHDCFDVDGRPARSTKALGSARLRGLVVVPIADHLGKAR